ncbi:MAG: pyruvate kinase [Eubacterium sp.]|nr:pyruvate kinase [Eubacterium sp.]
MKALELYGTLGPSDCDKDTLKAMFRCGMTGLRLNLSHKSLSECSGWLDQLHMASEELHIVPDLLVDLQGPELRIGLLNEPVSLKEGDIIGLSFDNASAFKEISIPVPACTKPYLLPGQKIRLDDGRIVLEVVGLNKARVLIGGTLQSRKSLALDGHSITLPTLTDKDIENISQLSGYRVTGVMLPFVRNAEDLITLKKALLDYGHSHVRIFAKIENQAGVNQLPSLIPHCDHIVIARGDLGNAVSLTKLPAVQKSIARICNRTKTPFMVVTQMLHTMTENPVPTRAEVSDIFNAVLDGASSLMLTGETAVGRYPAEAMKVLSDVSFEALRYKMESKFF